MSVDGDGMRAIAKQIEEYGARHEALQLELRAASTAQNKDGQEIERLRLRVLDLENVLRNAENAGKTASAKLADLEAERDEARAEVAWGNALLQASRETSAGLRQQLSTAMVALDALRVELERADAPRSCLDAVERALRGVAPVETTGTTGGAFWVWTDAGTIGALRTETGETLAGVRSKVEGWYWWQAFGDLVGPLNRQEAIDAAEKAARAPLPSPAGNLADRVAELEARLARLEAAK